MSRFVTDRSFGLSVSDHTAYVSSITAENMAMAGAFDSGWADTLDTITRASKTYEEDPIDFAIVDSFEASVRKPFPLTKFPSSGSQPFTSHHTQFLPAKLINDVCK